MVTCHQDSWKWKGSKASASLTHSYTQTQTSQELPVVLQDDDQGKKMEGKGGTLLQGNNPSAEAGKAGSPVAATSLHHISEEHMLGHNSGISEALPKFSNRETFISSKHG